MKCSLCGYNFSKKEAKSACEGCIVKGCGMVRCPNCNYENPIEPKLVSSFKRRVEKWKQLMKKKKS